MLWPLGYLDPFNLALHLECSVKCNLTLSSCLAFRDSRGVRSTSAVTHLILFIYYLNILYFVLLPHGVSLFGCNAHLAFYLRSCTSCASPPNNERFLTFPYGFIN